MNKLKAENKKVSIIIPVYNGEKYLRRCLDSIEKQTYANFEAILVDDGSTDNSYLICEEYQKKDKRFTLIHKKNEGVSKARNTALKIAKGDYISFVDSDDWAEPNMLELYLQKALQNDSDVVFSEYNNYYENTKESYPINLKNYDDKTFFDLICDETTQYGGFPWNKLVKKSFVKTMYCEKIHYYENFLFFLENGNSHTKYSVVHEKLYNYCINDTSAVHSKKYNIRKLTTLDALEIIIKKVPKKYQDFYKYLYICRAYENLYYIKKNKISNAKINIIIKKADIYYNEIKKSEILTLKQKMKILVHKKFRIFYKLYKLKELKK